MRLTLAVVAVVAAVGPVASQQRPDFSGDWLLVREASTPTDQSAMGTRARLVHRTNELAVEMTMYFLPAKGGSIDSNEFDAPKRYSLDGSEHEMPVGRPTSVFNPTDNTLRGILLPRWPTPGRYRATWTGDKLVLFSRDEVPFVMNDSLRLVAITVRNAFSYALDGTLVVERLDLREPVAGPKQEPAPVPLRSVYRRVR